MEPDAPDPWLWWSADPEMQMLLGTSLPGPANAEDPTVTEKEAEEQVRSYDAPSGGWSALVPGWPQLTWNQKLAGILESRPQECQSLSSTHHPLCLQCRYCRRPFLAKSRERPWSAGRKLEHHEAMCGKRQCDHCCGLFKNALECQGHMSLCRDNAKFHRCEFCTTRLKNTAEKRSHEATCELNPAMCCEFCGKHFGHTALRNRHMQGCIHDPRRLCVFCGQRFASRVDVVSHEVCCKDNPSTRFKEGECAACCGRSQCLSFPCGRHCYCAPCLLKMLQVGMKDRSLLPLRCCKKLVEIGDPVDVTLGTMMPEQARLKYQEAMMLRSARHAMYCPNVKCGVLIILDTLYSLEDVQAMRHGWTTEVDVSAEATSSHMLSSGPIGCPRCEQAICFKCRSEWHVGMTCPQYQYCARKNVDALTQFCRKMNWMRCFQCGHVVEKKAGCNHIICLCGSQFCYLCGATWGSCKCQIVGEGHALRHNRGPAAVSHTCPHCSQPFDSAAELRVHITMCQVAQTNSGGRYECATCHTRFTDYSQYRTHRRACVSAITDQRNFAVEDQFDARRSELRMGNASRPH